jgi:hypothetical protein
MKAATPMLSRGRRRTGTSRLRLTTGTGKDHLGHPSARKPLPRPAVGSDPASLRVKCTSLSCDVNKASRVGDRDSKAEDVDDGQEPFRSTEDRSGHQHGDEEAREQSPNLRVHPPCSRTLSSHHGLCVGCRTAVQRPTHSLHLDVEMLELLFAAVTRVVDVARVRLPDGDELARPFPRMMCESSICALSPTTST